MYYETTQTVKTSDKPSVSRKRDTDLCHFNWVAGKVLLKDKFSIYKDGENDI